MNTMLGDSTLLGSMPDIRTWPSADTEPPCELGRVDEPCPNPARWIMRPAPHGECFSTLVPRLACDDCKEARMHSDLGVVCRECGEVTEPARRAYVTIEAI